MQASDPGRQVADHTFVIVGTGFGGLGMAIHLKKQGINNFVILERAQDVGGVWRDNCYPGAACDVPSHLYSFSFEPNPNWSHTYARQDEIHAYLQHCAVKYDVMRHICFGAEVQEAEFDEQANRWNLSLTNSTQLSTVFLITATGQLSRPVIPQIPGQAEFKGTSFHSARWDKSLSLEGKRVAVIGTGASATQFVPVLAGQAKHLTVFQRSPSYMIARRDRQIPQWEKSLFQAFPWTMRLKRLAIYAKFESRGLAIARVKSLMKLAIGIPFRRMLKAQVPDAGLREKLTPQYQIGCKRILLSDDYLATYARPNVSLITNGIRRITETGIETDDGQQHPADVLVYGTGFAATEFLSPMKMVGLKGLDLNHAWANGAQAYLGLTLPGFPNFFMLYGPNTNLGHNSIVIMLEGQVELVMRLVKAMQNAKAQRVEVDQRTFTRFNQRIQERLAHTVWNGCKSWYVDADGHSSANWPGFTLTYRWLTRYSSIGAYKFTQTMGKPN